MHCYPPLHFPCLSLLGVALLLTTSQPSRAELVTYWPLDATGNDASGKGRHLALRNGAAIRKGAGEFMLGSGGLGGGGAEGGLDGVDDGAVANGSNGGSAYNGVEGTGGRTISAWVRGLAPGAGFDPYPTIVSWGGGGTPNGSRFDIRLLETAPLGRLRTEVNGGGSNSAAAGSVLLNDNQWHHLLVTMPDGAVDLADLAMFVDGKRMPQVRQNNPAINTLTIYPVAVGDSVLQDEGTFTDRNFRGWIDEVAIYDDGFAGSAGTEPSVSAALLNGLGRVAMLSQPSLEAAQLLWRNGGSAVLGGKTWFKARSLSGGLGDYGGSLAGNDAYVTLDAAGNGVALFTDGSPQFSGYPRAAYTFTVGASVTLLPDLRGQPPTGFSVSPPLPPGLVLNPATGVISGTATTPATATDHRITAAYPLPRPALTVTLRLEVRREFFDDFENRTGTLDPDETWVTSVFGNAGEDYRLEAGGNPGQRLDAPAGPETLATVGPLEWTAGRDFLLMSDVLITADAGLGGLIFGAEDASAATGGTASHYHFLFSDGAGEGGLRNLLFGSYDGSGAAREELALAGGLPIAFNQWYRLLVAHSAGRADFDLRLIDLSTRALVWREVVSANKHGHGKFGLLTEFGGNVRFDNYLASTSPALVPYPEERATYALGVPIRPNPATVLNGPATSFTVVPPLPAGLTLAAGTGTISGTPAAAAALISHLVTANFSGGGQASTTVEIGVSPSRFDGYPLASRVALLGTPAGQAITPLVPLVFGRAPSTYGITPPLPPGLSLNPVTGVISGTPAGRASYVLHTITAGYSSGEPPSQSMLGLIVIDLTGGFADTFDGRGGNLDDDPAWTTRVFGTQNGTDFVFEPDPAGGEQLDPPGGASVISTIDGLTLAAGGSFHFQADVLLKADLWWVGLLFGYQENDSSHYTVQINDGVEVGGIDTFRLAREEAGTITDLLLSPAPALVRNRRYRLMVNYEAAAASLGIRLFDLSTAGMVLEEVKSGITTLQGGFGLRTDFGGAAALDNVALDRRQGSPPAAGPVITDVVATETGLRLTWTTQAGRRYRVERSGDLSTGGWTVWQNDLPATGASLSVLDAAFPAGAKRFYRVSLQP